MLVRSDPTLAGSRAQRHVCPELADDVGPGRGRDPACVGPAGRAEVLVGHSFSGMIVTEAGVDPNVSAVVYVAARAPDAGEDYTELAKKFPAPPASAGIV